jgi:hypothetical protein
MRARGLNGPNGPACFTLYLLASVFLDRPWPSVCLAEVYPGSHHSTTLHNAGDRRDGCVRALYVHRGGSNQIDDVDEASDVSIEKDADKNGQLERPMKLAESNDPSGEPIKDNVLESDTDEAESYHSLSSQALLDEEAQEDRAKSSRRNGDDFEDDCDESYEEDSSDDKDSASDCNRSEVWRGGAHESKMSVSERRLEVKSLRQQGKILHDSDEMEEAAHLFKEAGDILDDILDLCDEEKQQRKGSSLNSTISGEQAFFEETNAANDSTSSDSVFSSDDRKDLAEEAAACHLHQALCQLKNNDARDSLIACNKVINDADYVVSDSNEASSGLYHGVALSSAVTSRAFHRRAKSKLALNDLDGALSDARSAAFLGDRGAVALYGKLMRQGNNPSLESEGQMGSSFGGNDRSPDPSNWLLGPAAASLTAPHGAEGAGTSNSLLPFLSGLPSGGILDALNPKSDGKSGLEDVVGSLVSNLGKQLSETESQEKICGMVNTFGTKASVTQMAIMAGVPMSETNADRISGFCSSLTPQKLDKGVILAKRCIKVAQVGRKMIKLVSKFRHILVYILLLSWMRRIISER